MGDGIKVVRDNPNAGKLNPMQSQLMEEHGSDQRLRLAAEFWREHNKQLEGKRQKRMGMAEGIEPAQMPMDDPKALGDFMAKGKGGMGREGQEMGEMGPMEAQSMNNGQGENLAMEVLERNQNR